MAGGLMQLVAYGAQDVYLTGQTKGYPYISFFNFNFVRKTHTNFSMEQKKLTANGTCDFGGKVDLTVKREGDLVSDMYVKATMSATSSSTDYHWRWAKNLGYRIFKSVELSIGGQRIDKHLSQWMSIWNDLTNDKNHLIGLNEMLGNNNNSWRTFSNTDVKEGETTVYVPLNFFFNRSSYSALPLIALQYHEVNIHFEFADKEDVYAKYGGSSINITPSIDSFEVIANYIYLDTDERKKFAQSSHEYIIEQVQEQVANGIAANSQNGNVELNFNHPVKALYWVNAQNHIADPNVTSILDPYGSIHETIKNFALRYFVPNATTIPKGTSLISVDESSGVIKAIKPHDSANRWVPTAKFNTNFDVKINNRFIKYNDIQHFFNSINLTFNNLTGSDITTDKTSVNKNLRNLVVINQSEDVIRRDHGFVLSAILNGDHSKLDSSGTSAVDVFQTTDTSTGDSTLITGKTHWWGNGVEGQTIESAKLKLNGNDRFDSYEAEYFNLVQPYQHHKNVPPHGLYMYSFALNPGDTSPSGSCNFSRIDNALLEITIPKNRPASTISVYAVNYNVLRIMSGMGGLAYSN